MAVDEIAGWVGCPPGSSTDSSIEDYMHRFSHFTTSLLREAGVVQLGMKEQCLDASSEDSCKAEEQQESAFQYDVLLLGFTRYVATDSLTKPMLTAADFQYCDAAAILCPWLQQSWHENGGGCSRWNDKHGSMEVSGQSCVLLCFEFAFYQRISW